MFNLLHRPLATVVKALFAAQQSSVRILILLHRGCTFYSLKSRSQTSCSDFRL